MASSKEHRLTLNLDFNTDKAKLQEIGNAINKITDKSLTGGKAVEYLNNINFNIMILKNFNIVFT